MGKRIVLDDYIAKLRDERSIEITTRDGSVFTIDPPQLWPNGIRDVGNVVDQAKMLLGDERYDAFVALGGTAEIINALIAEGFDADVPE